MEGNYAVTLGDKPVGKVQVLRQGLYYRFICRCQLSGEVIYKLLVTCGAHQESLGICVPMDGGFGLDTRLPIKRLGEGNPVFRMVPKHSQMEGQFVPVYPEEPFAYLAKLKNAYLAKRGEEIGVILPREEI